jgi:2-Cys peroxiredoxin 5
LYTLLGAFTPGCHKTHAPGYVANADKYRAKGVDEIVIITVNDAFVAGAWAEALGAEGKVRILADANAELTKALGLELDLTGPFGLGGLRTKRFSAYVVNSEIKIINMEPDFTGLTCTLSDGLLSQIE